MIAPAPGGDGYVQRVLDTLDFELPCEDLSALPADRREAELMARMQAIVDTPMALHAAPLFRAALYKLAHEEHAFLFMPHHIVWDGWSFDLMHEDLAAIYGALVSGETPAPPVPAISYLDYAEWLAEWMKGPEAARQLQYWKNRFAIAPLPKQPKTDKPRQPGMSGEGATEWVRFDRELTERLRDVARVNDLTLSMLAMSVYAAMMATAIGTQAIVVGLPVRGRQAPETEGVMGFFNNLLPVQFVVDPARTFAEFLQGVEARHARGLRAARSCPSSASPRSPRSPAARAASACSAASCAGLVPGRARAPARVGPAAPAVDPVVPEGRDRGSRPVADGSAGRPGRRVHLQQRHLPARDGRGPARALHRTAAPHRRRTRRSRWPSSSPADGSPAAQRLRAHGRRPGRARPRPPPVAAVAGGGGRRGRVRGAMPCRSSRSDNERALAKIWAGLLDVEVAHIAPGDNFFDLGGNSLLAMRAVEFSGRTLGFRIDARRYFYESLAQLANESAGRAGARGGSDAGPRTGRVARASQARLRCPGWEQGHEVRR